LIERVVTVTGSAIRRPANLLVKIGTPFAELIEQCGGLKEAPAKIIMGGPLTGITVPSSEVPVIKATNGILALSQSEIDAQPVSPCLRCARCVDACPQFLLPNFLADFAEKEHFAQAKDYGALDCIECGICTYICPAKRNLVQLIKLAKFIICKQS
jgi:electron transport complex protein RnfC